MLGFATVIMVIVILILQWQPHACALLIHASVHLLLLSPPPRPTPTPGAPSNSIPVSRLLHLKIPFRWVLVELFLTVPSVISYLLCACILRPIILYHCQSNLVFEIFMRISIRPTGQRPSCGR